MDNLSDEQKRLVLEFTGLSMLKLITMEDGETEAYIEGMKDAFEFMVRFSETEGETVENIFETMDAEDFDEYMQQLFKG